MQTLKIYSISNLKLKNKYNNNNIDIKININKSIYDKTKNFFYKINSVDYSLAVNYFNSFDMRIFLQTNQLHSDNLLFLLLYIHLICRTLWQLWL